MRPHNVLGTCVVVVALLAVSAGALAQAPAVAPSPQAATDAGAALAIDAGVSGPDAALEVDAGANAATAPDSGGTVDAAPPPVAQPTGGAAARTEVQAPSYMPSEVGFSFGLRSGYSIPFGAANGSSLSDVVQGVIPVGIEAGWYFNPHLYVGGYFLYGFTINPGANIPLCDSTAGSGFPESCSATMFRFGVVAHWHFRPLTDVDPWVGGGLGYDIINIEATDQSDGTLDSSAALHGVVVSIEGGVDFKPLRYFGLGPFVELASGHYSSDTSSTSLHEWLTFGVRLRTNL